MQKSKARTLAERIIGVLKYNPQLTEDEKTLCVESHLDGFAKDIEQACAEMHNRTQKDTIIVSTLPQDIEPLQKLMLAHQQSRGLLN